MKKITTISALLIFSAALSLFTICSFIAGCNNNPPINTQTTALADSSAYHDSVASRNYSLYYFTPETQINIYGATVDGATFYNACQNIDMLFFVYPKTASK